MAVVHFLEGTMGRAVRAGAGAVLVGLGAGLGGGWWALAAVGLVPLGAAVFNVCLLAPLFGQPFRPVAGHGRA